MAHESFEDEATAAVMNERFVNIKVDREERPDVDAVYMTATQALTGRGGWPMSVFLDHDRQPFYAGTYWPKAAGHGPTFLAVLDAIHDAWLNRRAELLESAASIASSLSRATDVAPEDTLDQEIPSAATEVIVERAWDRQHGGFGRAPKFPQAMTLAFLLSADDRAPTDESVEAVTHSLQAMAAGGIHDQIAGGFARYATDNHWLVPHFEKMLYDNALLLDVYAAAGVRTDDEELQRVARGIGRYLIKEMQDSAGGFYSATDADSEGVEGKYFVWSDEEFRDVATATGADADLMAAFYDVLPGGNFRPEAAGHAPERANILHVPVGLGSFCHSRSLDPAAFRDELDRLRAALYGRRQKRVPPLLDDKVLVSWNALAIRALSRAGLLLDEPDFVAAAERAAHFIRTQMVVDGRLHHSWRAGVAAIPAFLEDVAGMAAASIDLAAATGNPEWIQWALELAEDAVARFAAGDGTYFQTADDAEELVTRPRETWDNATPSGNSLLASASWQLWRITGDDRWREVTDGILLALQSQVRKAPTGFGELLAVFSNRLASQREIAVVGPEGPQRHELVRAAAALRPAGSVLVVANDGVADGHVPISLLAGRSSVDGRPAAFVCRDFACDLPALDAPALKTQLTRDIPEPT